MIFRELKFKAVDNRMATVVKWNLDCGRYDDDADGRLLELHEISWGCDHLMWDGRIFSRAMFTVPTGCRQQCHQVYSLTGNTTTNGWRYEGRMILIESITPLE